MNASRSTARARGLLRVALRALVGDVGGAGGVDRQLVALAALRSGLMASSARASPIQASASLASETTALAKEREAARGSARSIRSPSRRSSAPRLAGASSSPSGRSRSASHPLDPLVGEGCTARDCAAPSRARSEGGDRRRGAGARDTAWWPPWGRAEIDQSHYRTGNARFEGDRGPMSTRQR